MSLLNKDGILAAALRTKDVPCPELRGTVRLRELSVGQLKDISEDSVAQLALMIVDEDGVLQFRAKEDIERLREISAAAVTRLLTEAATLNGISAVAVEDAVKNSDASPTPVSVSA